jgi:predicted Zn-ribbon and HTH transcriptional regulator
MKTCSKCKKEKTPEEFSFRWKEKKIRHRLCRECQRTLNQKHYAKNSEAIKEAVNSRKFEAKRLVFNMKHRKQCKDCGGTFNSWQMDFDHRDPSSKVESVSTLVKMGTIETILTEIAKCDLVCANCHRDRTFKKFGVEGEAGPHAELEPQV